MKTKINSLFDTLGYVLRRLGTIETKLIDDVGMHTDEITSTVVRCEVDDYLGSLNDNLLGMERIFSYLMMNNSIRKDSVVQDLVHELEGLLAATEESFLKDIFFSLPGCEVSLLTRIHCTEQRTK